MLIDETDMVIRDTIVLTPSQLRDEIKAPENIRIKFDDSVRCAPFDIGSLAFSERIFTSNSWKDAAEPSPVYFASLRQERRNMLINIFDYISSSKYRDSSRFTKLKDFKSIIDMCDQFGCSDFMQSPVQCRSAYKRISDELRHKIKMDFITQNQGAILQRTFKLLIGLCFSREQSAMIVERVNTIKYQRNRTKPPKEQHFIHYIQTTIALARQLKSFVVEEKNFPINLKMSDYEAYVFQSHSGNVKTPYTTNHNSTYNFEEGRLSTFEEWKDKVKKSEKSQYNRAVVNFEEVNRNKRHERRIDFATLSMQAYMKIFILLTGAQPSEVRQLEYSSEFELEKDNFKNDFRAIKFRAKGRNVSYNLGDSYGYALFKEYLELRKWVLNGDECKMLFFSVTQKKNSEKMRALAFNPIGSGGNFYNYFYRIKGIYVPEDFGDITSCPARKYKNLILSELKVSLSTRAAALNHTIETNSLDYTETTPDRQAEEFSAHWSAVKKAREHVDLTGKHSKKITSGHCVDEGKPESEIENPPIEPDCKNQYGCLFCVKYSCHADEEDAHKLFSLLFVIETVRDDSTNFSHAEKTFQMLSIRAKEILKTMADKSEAHQAMVDKIEKKVMVNGTLTAFWERRLDQYERMGIIASD
ncbi:MULTISPECIES: hypothetical protein [unclassified Pseudoalteromonas]|uniref:hypothetical protein n=1 Tax=unclassified Pseudoalteromonas TaxID=194690 RepID=UPI0004B99CDC|nr:MULTISPECIES: hypothetical protein [unclassified Pseudoalteromonas]